MNELESLYAQIPPLRCIGKCQESCGPVPTSPAEAAAIEDAGGIVPDVSRILGSETLSCPNLGPLGNCSIHDSRPMLCRLWGVVESMKCPHGCKPEGGHLPDEDGHRLLLEAHQL